MATHTTGGRALAIAAGLLFTAGALTILLEDVVLAHAPWTLQHLLTIVTVAGTIMGGHLASTARASGRWLAVLGFAVVFLVGTALTVYYSVGRQAEHTMVAAAQVKVAEDARATAEAGLASASNMLAAAQADLARECRTGKGKRCDGIAATVSVYEAAVRGHQADLERLGPPKVAVPEARRAGELAAVFGADPAKVEAGAILLVPFLRTLLMEFGAIVAFGFAFAPSHWKPSPRVSLQTSFALVDPANDAGPGNGGNGGNRRRSLSKQAAEADVVRLFRDGGSIPSQDTFSTRWEVGKGTVSKWLADFERRGLIERETVGRCKQVRAA